MKKESKKTIITLISIVVVLGITCAISIAYNFLGGFYLGRIERYNAMLGEDLNIKIKDEGIWGVGCNFSGTLILGENFKQNVFIDVTSLQSPLYIRARAFISGVECDVNMSGTTNWIKAEDDYYYFNQPINSLDKLQLCNNLIFQSEMNLDGYKDYILFFVIQADTNNWDYTMGV